MLFETLVLYYFGLYAVFAAYLAFSTSYCFYFTLKEPEPTHVCMWNQEDS